MLRLERIIDMDNKDEITKLKDTVKKLNGH